MDPAHGELIRGWLGLPPGPWPPDHYALLALPPGAGDLSDIEERVLDRMERLRAHQLRHPDAVTEGMNRLAQALVCLTDPVARAGYDSGLGLARPAFEVVEDEPLLPEPADPAATLGHAKLPYEVVADEPTAPRAVPFELVDDEPLAEELPPAFEVVSDAPGPARPGGKPPKLKPRTVYRRLAALRRAVAAWEGLRPVLGTPGEALATPISVLLFVRALRAARAALPGAGFVLDEVPVGRVVAVLVSAPAALAVVRGLLPSQREAVARDWRAGHRALTDERDRLRRLARRARAGRRARANWVRAVCRTPELLLLVLALAVAAAALARRAL